MGSLDFQIYVATQKLLLSDLHKRKKKSFCSGCHKATKVMNNATESKTEYNYTIWGKK